METSLKDILIVLHQEQSSPGRVGQMLEEMGYRLDIRKPRFGDTLPETMDEHKGAIIFGGPMSANDTDDFVKQEIDWCGVPLKEQAPFFGICLGAQMLVKHMGGEVSEHPEGHAEIGYYPLRDVRCEIGNSPFPKVPEMIYQWHREGFSLPSGAELLAVGDSFENQAFQVGPSAFGVQFHTELTMAMMYRWLTKGAERLSMPGTQQRGEHISGRLQYDAAVKAWLKAFLANWLAADPRR